MIWSCQWNIKARSRVAANKIVGEVCLPKLANKRTSLPVWLPIFGEVRQNQYLMGLLPPYRVWNEQNYSRTPRTNLFVMQHCYACLFANIGEAQYKAYLSFKKVQCTSNDSYIIFEAFFAKFVCHFWKFAKLVRLQIWLFVTNPS